MGIGLGSKVEGRGGGEVGGERLERGLLGDKTWHTS
jgi:hypothetical protein